MVRDTSWPGARPAGWRKAPATLGGAGPGTPQGRAPGWADRVEAVASLIRPTLAPVPPVAWDPGAGRRAVLACELCQPAGSIWGRGAVAAVARLAEDHPCRWLVAGGDSAWCRAVAYAAACWSIPCTVAVPARTPGREIARIGAWDAGIFCRGASRRGAACAARGIAAAIGAAFLDPESDPDVAVGCASFGAELLSMTPETAGVLLVGSPGPAADIAAYLRLRRPGLPVLVLPGAWTGAYDHRGQSGLPPTVARAARRMLSRIPPGDSLLVAMLGPQAADSAGRPARAGPPRRGRCGGPAFGGPFGPGRLPPSLPA